MIEKRFTINGTWGKSLNRLKGVICDNNKDMYITDVVNLLNELSEENGQLEKEKERYKRLSKIRQQEIDNRILTIKEFINNCSDNKVRSALKELFYSEVNEYDLSLKYRELTDENEQLKKEIESWKKHCINHGIAFPRTGGDFG